jgi:hypothetical protein
MRELKKNSVSTRFSVVFLNSAWQIPGYQLIIDRDHFHIVADISFIIRISRSLVHNL